MLEDHPRSILRALLALASFAILGPSSGCHDEVADAHSTAPKARALRPIVVTPAEPRRSPTPRASTTTTVAAAAQAATLMLGPPPRCAEGGYHVYPPFVAPEARSNPSAAAAIFCLFQRPAAACGQPRMLIWQPDPLDRRPCLRFEPRKRRFTLLRDWQRAPDRFPHVASMDPLTVCRDHGRCQRYPLGGLQSAALDPTGARVAVRYEAAPVASRRRRRRAHRARRERRVDIYQLAPWRRLRRLELPKRPVRVQLLGNVLAWVEHRGYASGVTHLVDTKTKRELRLFGSDARPSKLRAAHLPSPGFNSLLSPLVHVYGARWAALDGQGQRIAIQDVETGALVLVELDAYYRPLGRRGDRARTAQPGQARMVGLGGARLAVFFGDPVIGAAVIDGKIGAVVDVVYAPCF